MEHQEPTPAEPQSLIPAGQIAVISFLACFLFFSGMAVMYLWMTPAQRVPAYPAPGFWSSYGTSLWHEVFIPLWRGLGHLFTDHAYCLITIFLLAGDRILNAIVALYGLCADYRGYILVFLGGAAFVIAGSYILSAQTRPSAYTPCPPGQMLTAGGSCIWMNGY